MPQRGKPMFTEAWQMEAAMPEDIESNSDPGDDLNVLAGVIALVSLALIATALLS